LVHEMHPPGGWNKGRAVVWLLGRLGLTRSDVCPLCLGDDLTDEDMFTATRSWGVSAVVGDPDRPTAADYLLRTCDEAAALLEVLGTRDARRSRPGEEAGLPCPKKEDH
jgi:trehalose 6-phosphate phosphatase